MLTRFIGTFAAIIVGTMSASFAKGGAPPTIDLQKTCQASVAAAAAVIGNTGQGDIDVCMQDEQGAQMQLLQEWEEFPALARSRCVKPREYVPSYVEWLACLEMTRDVMKVRKEQSASEPSAPSGSRDCPVVRVDQNGELDWVIACRLATEK
jgi:hypothetical protein